MHFVRWKVCGRTTVMAAFYHEKRGNFLGYLVKKIQVTSLPPSNFTAFSLFFSGPFMTVEGGEMGRDGTGWNGMGWDGRGEMAKK